MAGRPDGVFINVPFDARYKKLLDALIFAVHDCGFLSRCAKEQGDSSQVRLEKLYTIIEECPFGIHDLSRTTLDPVNSSRLVERYIHFKRDLPRICGREGLEVRELSFLDYRAMVTGWVEANEW